MLLLAAFGVKRHQIDVNVGLRNPLYANVEMARYLIGGFNIALNARRATDSSCQRKPRAVISANSCGASTVPRTLTIPFAMPPSPAAHYPARRIDGGVKIQLLNAKLAFYIGAVWAQRKVQPGIVHCM